MIIVGVVPVLRPRPLIDFQYCRSFGSILAVPSVRFLDDMEGAAFMQPAFIVDERDVNKLSGNVARFYSECFRNLRCDVFIPVSTPSSFLAVDVGLCLGQSVNHARRLEVLQPAVLTSMVQDPFLCDFVSFSSPSFDCVPVEKFSKFSGFCWA